MPWDFLLILLVLGVVVPWRGTLRIKQLLARPRLETADRLALYASTIAFQWIAVAVVAWRCLARGISGRDLGLAIGEPELTTATALALALILSGIQFLSLRRLACLPAEHHGYLHRVAQKLLPHNHIEVFAFATLATTVALCEEFLYRGFVFTVLQRAAADSLLVAALGSSAMFALAHLYQGRRGLASTFIVGMIFAVTRMGTESLAPSVLAHLLTDLMAGLWAPRMLTGPSDTAKPATAATPPAGQAEDR